MIKGIGMALAVLNAFRIQGMTPQFLPLISPRHNIGRYAAKRHNKTGASYPHSSARQRARYARQIAAGKLQMEIITTAPPVDAKPARKRRAKVTANV